MGSWTNSLALAYLARSQENRMEQLEPLDGTE